ncbi:DUF2199 domain-containing protein [Dyella acidiphila]|uniref:DUF2199 domain-containing protein n=1 Tax=Dyella acidiphila TaxID=2775866 RepID=A0ABR9GEK7_9GAMM|nr:DUF2199 domain-containing protein [Dyella acidiphila]MBE1162455.1 DUF2199 domain-containing protein [Dyella acidiphila]
MLTYTCSCCGETHAGSPSFGYKAPHYYDLLSDEDKTQTAELDDDICVIGTDEQCDRFVRAILEVPILGSVEPFLWGVWVSLSEASFKRYLMTWDEPDESDSYFGWFSNRLPHYPDTLNLKTSVRPRKGGLRPCLVLEQSDHPLAMHFHQGLSAEEAQQIAERVMHPQ